MKKITAFALAMFIASFFPEFEAPAIVGFVSLGIIAGDTDRSTGDSIGKYIVFLISLVAGIFYLESNMINSPYTYEGIRTIAIFLTLCGGTMLGYYLQPALKSL